MLRTAFLLIPALAFATPFLASDASARPLVSAEQPAEFCDDDCDDNDSDVQICLHLEVAIDDGACFNGDTCLDSCSEMAADTCGQQLSARSAHAYESCLARMTRSCQRSCTNSVASLCEPRWDDDDHDDHDDADVFIELEICIQIDN